MNSPKKTLGMFAALAILSLSGTALAAHQWDETYFGEAEAPDFSLANELAQLNLDTDMLSKGAISDKPETLCHNGFVVPTYSGSHVLRTSTKTPHGYWVTAKITVLCSDVQF